MNFKSQKDLFEYIWDTRPHVSELSGKPLLHKGHILWYHQFLHVLPKGAYPFYKLKEENVLLGLPGEHANQNQFEVFNKKYEELRREYYKEFYNKKF